MNINKERKQKSAIYATIARIVLVTIVGGLLLSACGAAEPETYTVGVICYHAHLEQIFEEGLKVGLAESGYVEGENITYIYNGLVAPEAEAIDAEIKNLLDQDIDLLFTIGSLPTLRAKEAVEGTDIPVIFTPMVDAVKEGAVESIAHPGGNVTGVQAVNSVPKAMDWLITIVPGVEKVYVPYHPEEISAVFVAPLLEAGSSLGVEFVAEEVHTPEEVVAGIKALPEDVGAILISPSPSLDNSMGDFIQAATERGLAVGSTSERFTNQGALLGYGTEWPAMGKQAARLVDQVLQGGSPADLPVESGESLLSINLKTAEAIGLDIPDGVLRQARTIIR